LWYKEKTVGQILYGGEQVLISSARGSRFPLYFPSSMTNCTILLSHKTFLFGDLIHHLPFLNIAPDAPESISL